MQQYENPSQQRAGAEDTGLGLSSLTKYLLIVCAIAVAFFVVYKPVGQLGGNASTQVFTTTPALSASQIDTILQAYKSPAQGLGNSIYAQSLQTGVNDSFTLALFLQESSMGTMGVATVTHNVGNIRCSEGYTCYEGYRSYSSWADGFQDLDNLLVGLYKVQFKATTVQDIITRYAPSNENDTTAYVKHVQTAMEQWSAGKTVVNW